MGFILQVHRQRSSSSSGGSMSCLCFSFLLHLRDRLWSEDGFNGRRWLCTLTVFGRFIPVTLTRFNQMTFQPFCALTVFGDFTRTFIIRFTLAESSFLCFKWNRNFNIWIFLLLSFLQLDFAWIFPSWKFLLEYIYQALSSDCTFSCFLSLFPFKSLSEHLFEVFFQTKPPILSVLCWGFLCFTLRITIPERETCGDAIYLSCSFPVEVKSVRGDLLQLSTSMLDLNFVSPVLDFKDFKIPSANNQRNRPAAMINSKKSDFQRGRRVRQSLQNVTRHPFQLPVWLSDGTFLSLWGFRSGKTKVCFQHSCYSNLKYSNMLALVNTKH